MAAVLRRYKVDQYDRAVIEVRAGDLVLDFNSHDVTRSGKHIEVTAIEFRILFMLTANANRVIPYPRLVEYAWGYDGGDAGLLKTHVCHIREKLNLPLSGNAGIKDLGAAITAAIR